MLKSMTGYGQGFLIQGQNRLNIEIKSVNSRFLEIKFRGIRLDYAIENKIKKIIEQRLIRGNVLVYFEFDGKNQSKKISFNKNRFELIKNILKNIHVNYGHRISLGSIISTNDLLDIEEESLPDPDLIYKLVEDALEELNEMRIMEGKIISKDILKRVKLIKKILKSLESKTKLFKELKHKELENNIKKLLSDENLDENRLIQEVGYLSEKMDVTEEIIRAKSHFEQLLIYLGSSNPVGKKVNFLLQEVGREINTIGAKSHQSDVTIDVVEIKAELEKIREQIQNIL